MTVGQAESVRPSAGPGFEVVVLLCGHAAGTVRRDHPAGTDHALSTGTHGVRIAEAADLCERPSQISDLIECSGDQRLVIGLCAGRLSRLHAETYARKARFDPLALQVVEFFRDHSGDPGGAAAELTSRLRAACARAAAFPGARPENHRAVLADSRQPVSRRDLFTLPPVRYRVAPTIDQAACAAPDGCDLCAAACPTGAVRREGDRFSVDRTTCTACGLCLEACPESAVQFPGSSPGEIWAEIAALLGDTSGPMPAIAFVCREAGSRRLPGWLPVRVTCVNSLPVATMLQTLTHGASAVAMVDCVPPCGGAGSGLAVEKVDYCRSLLQRLNDPDERVVLLDPSDPRSPPRPGRRPIAIRDGTAGTTHGKGAAGAAVLRLADALEAGDVTLEHAASPLGSVSVDGRVCTLCGTCAVACPSGAFRREESGQRVALTFDPGLCGACGRCVAACPERARGAIHHKRATDLAGLRIGRRRVAEGESVSCAGCGRNAGSTRMLDRVRELLGDGHAALPAASLCSSCRASSWSLRSRDSL